ncbi:hypothetical protein Back11_44040 [Paenibacillus baekrokdamisoli]|uniref:Phytanoyl-CoA dioxygenase n=1 Tax=Paenibacillus baekrokdamisoli TaxID=1712516 RepID=A0A3G9JJ49_9BACL|nr:phytanoyl-CoA dioxygenase family protein [Paenibacillus baekrokdamisoli]BBH23059.1 hypothetical protein Back11_44040 [Paenibacillus baekrokdamisoli]
MAIHSLMREAADHYQRDGYYIGADVFSEEEVKQARNGTSEVLGGRYDLGVAPSWGSYKPEHVGSKLVKVNDAHLSNKAIYNMISSAKLGEWAAAVTGANMVQVWLTQLIHKPGNVEERGNIGWHQDYAYWSHWEGEVFTSWIALSDVMELSGPMAFVKQSHRWGFLEDTANFNDHDLERQKEKLHREGRVWDEANAVLRPGQASFHHPLTLHGSGSNRSTEPRLSIAIHMRTEKSKQLLNTEGKLFHDLSNPYLCPVIYQK